MARFTLLALLGTLILSSVACSSSDEAGANDAAIAVQNDTSVRIDNVYISPSSSSTWGDALGGIEISALRTWIMDAPGAYDVRVVFADGVIDYSWGVIAETGYTQTVTFMDLSGASLKVRRGDSHADIPLNKLDKAGVPNLVQ